MNRTEMQKYASEYLLSVIATGKSAATRTNYEKSIRLFAESLKPSESVTHTAICRWRDKLAERLRLSTVKQYMLDISAFLSWLVSMGYISDNLIQSDDIPTVKNNEQVMLTEQEILALLNYSGTVRYEKNPRKNRAIFAVLMTGGLRSDELRSLRVADLDFENGKITVKRGKGGKKRVAPFPEQTRELAKEYLTGAKLAPTDLVFPGANGQKLSSVTLNQLVARRTEAIIGKKIHTHTLRHCAASLWADIGVPIRDVQLALGHASVRTTEQIYVHVLNKEQAANKINDAFQKTVDKTAENQI